MICADRVIKGALTPKVPASQGIFLTDSQTFNHAQHIQKLTANAHFLRLQKLVVEKPFPDLVRHVREIGLIGITWDMGHGDVLKSGRDTGDGSPESYCQKWCPRGFHAAA